MSATEPATTDPLRLGILGATRIAPLSIVSPGRATGTRGRMRRSSPGPSR